MIAVDTNILIYAHFRSLPKHERALKKITELAQGNHRWGIPLFCIGEFLRVVTHPRVFEDRFSVEEASAALGRLLRSPSLRVLSPGPRFIPLFLEAIREAGASGNLVFDAQIVALCREAGISALLTEDRDYARFQKFVVLRLK